MQHVEFTTLTFSSHMKDSKTGLKEVFVRFFFPVFVMSKSSQL